jgi:DNA mismatch repair protein MutS2
VRLLGARHPLLDPATAVPIDLDLGDLRALVISGPNTGGKTVALKTLGVAALLHQSGLRPPAARVALPVFDRLVADIGDQQSIEMSLSTFSAHIANVVSILRTATDRSLVLIDELASGTDPAEGGALAQAVLTQLAQQARLTVVTTHHPELKEWASATKGRRTRRPDSTTSRTRRSTGSSSDAPACHTHCKPPSASAWTSRSWRTRATASHPRDCG